MGNNIFVNTYHKGFEGAVWDLQAKVFGRAIKKDEGAAKISCKEQYGDSDSISKRSSELCTRKILVETKVSELPKGNPIKTVGEFVRIDKIDGYFDDAIGPAPLFLHYIQTNSVYKPLQDYFSLERKPFWWTGYRDGELSIDHIVIRGDLIEAAKEFIAIDKVSGTSDEHIAEYLFSSMADGSLTGEVVKKISAKVKKVVKKNIEEAKQNKKNTIDTEKKKERTGNCKISKDGNERQ